MSELIDCRGLSCPEPVLLARRAMQEASGNAVTVLVSSAVARDNISRAAATLGWKAAVESDGDGFRLKLTR